MEKPKPKRNPKPKQNQQSWTTPIIPPIALNPREAETIRQAIRKGVQLGLHIDENGYAYIYC